LQLESDAGGGSHKGDYAKWRDALGDFRHAILHNPRFHYANRQRQQR